MNWLALNAPMVNTGLLMGLLLIFMAVVLWVIRQAPHWRGPGQHLRLTYVERKVDALERRSSLLEDNHGVQYRELLDSMEGLRMDLRRLFEMVAANASLPTRVSLLEDRKTDLEQQLQGFHDLGCGYPDCPQRKAAEPKA